MFFPPKLTTIVFSSLIAVFAVNGIAEQTHGQQGEFERRMAAMQEARLRAASPTRIASNDMGVDFAAPPAPVRTAQLPNQNQVRTQRKVRAASRPVGGTQNVARRQQALNQPTHVAQAGQYVPQHARASQQVRTAQLIDQTFIDGGSPIVSSGTVIGDPYGGQIISGGQVISGGVIEGGCSDCSTGTCGDSGGYFEDSCCDRGGCPSCLSGGCLGDGCLVGNGFWLNGLASLFYNAEYFGGATAFRSSLFPTPGGAPGTLSDDSSQGFFGGVNAGFPLCRLSGGLLSGQLGVRSVHTNFDGNEFTPDNRDQLFLTAGLFRRVDYGLQLGVVADILYDNWFADTEVVQLRGDIGWVYPGGSTFGFRFAQNVQDDVNTGTFAGNTFTDLVTTSNDNYRFYYRLDAPSGGFGETYLGWSDSEQTIFGVDFDMPVTEQIGVQAGFTYFFNDDNVPATSNFLGGNVGEAYNFFVGFAFRPRGRSYYRSYDRPLFSVADNGTLSIIRSGGQ